MDWDQGFTLRPSLHVPNIVRNTSPHFVVLYKCKKGYMQMDRALSEIKTIISSRQGSLYDINRDGRSWLEVGFFHQIRGLNTTAMYLTNHFSRSYFPIRGVTSRFNLLSLTSSCQLICQQKYQLRVKRKFLN